MAPRLPNMRPRLDVAEEDSDVEGSAHVQVGEESLGSDDEASDEDDSSNVHGDEDAAEEQSYEQQISNVSFGALKEAQDNLSKKRKRGSETNEDQEDKLGALRARLQQIKKQKNNAAAKGEARTNKSSRADDENESDSESDSDSDAAPSEEGAPKSRTSKHAPTAQSSRHQVTRKRQVVDVPKRVVRDPRFDALHRTSAHPGNSDKAYSFLQDYQKSEISELKDALKRAKSEEDREKLKRKIGSMENKLKAKAAKEREQKVLRRHRREEKARIEQGKTPYYLKKKDIKEQALVEKFKGMKSKDREKLIERRRRKEGQKEKKRMPDARRFATGSNAVQSRG